jgi:hypothetical protein
VRDVSRLLVEAAVSREVHAFEVRGRKRSAAADLFLREVTPFRWPG